jgi:LPS sulfotransferase NodH
MVDIVYIVVSGDTDPDSAEEPFNMADASAFSFATYEDAEAFWNLKVEEQGVDSVIIGSPVIRSW